MQEMFSFVKPLDEGGNIWMSFFSQLTSSSRPVEPVLKGYIPLQLEKVLYHTDFLERFYGSFQNIYTATHAGAAGRMFV